MNVGRDIARDICTVKGRDIAIAFIILTVRFLNQLVWMSVVEIQEKGNFRLPVIFYRNAMMRIRNLQKLH